MRTRPFQELLAWKEAHALCIFTYKITKDFPNEEKYGLTNQMRRSSYSVPTNIAESTGRKTSKDKQRFLDISTGSLEELYYQGILARDLGYLSSNNFDTLDKLASKAGYLIYRYGQSLKNSQLCTS